MSKVVIFIFYHGNEEELKKSIESILSQTYREFIIYIVDKRTEKQKDEDVLPTCDSRFFVLDSKKNNLDSLVKNTKAGAVAFFRSGDVWAPHTLEKMLDRFQESQAKKFVFPFSLDIIQNQEETDFSTDTLHRKISVVRFWLESRKYKFPPSVLMAPENWKLYKRVTDGFLCRPSLLFFMSCKVNGKIHISENYRLPEEKQKPADERYLEYGTLVNEWVDIPWYIEKYKLPLNIDPVEHYICIGWRMGYDPSFTFSTAYCLTKYASEIPIFSCPLFWVARYSQSENLFSSAEQKLQREQVAETALFDWAWYEKTYFTNGAGEKDLILHYLQLGAHLGYSPSELFDSTFYISHLPNNLVCEGPPLLHYLEKGKAINAAFFDPNISEYQMIKNSILFDQKWYSEMHMPGDLYIEAAWFYLKKGDRLGHNPSLLFDRSSYRKVVHCDENHNTLIDYLSKLGPNEVNLERPIPPGMERMKLLSFEQGLSYLTPEEKKLQDQAIKNKEYDNVKEMIIHLVPPYTKVSGGILSIAQIAQDTQAMLGKKNVKVFLATFSKEITFFTYPNFDCSMPIFRFEQFPRKFTVLDSLTIHIPELYIEPFINTLSMAHLSWLKSIPNLKINILNQNIQLMPTVEITKQLTTLTENVTQTVAHSAYCTREVRDKYGYPLQRLTPWVDIKYIMRSYKEKENLLLYSPDYNEKKEDVLGELRKEFPAMEQREINNLSYKEYLNLISEAKWVITFGEGLDAYFSEPFRSGGISFAVYNDEFFLPENKSWPTVFLSYDEMEKKLPEKIKELDDEVLYTTISAEMQKEFNTDEICEQHMKDLRNYYQGNYMFP